MLHFSWDTHPPERLLCERFHIETGFHPKQREIIAELEQGKRVLAIQKTGWGKSLCYQMASLYQPYLTIIFSPLKALMRDQCHKCNTVYDIPSAIVSSDFSTEENNATLQKALDDELKLLFIAPERLHNDLWQIYVTQLKISMLVIDEAHCISLWGHDFRPSYRRIANLLTAIPHQIPVLALTATANQRVEADILQQIGINTKVIRGTMLRPNLQLEVVALTGENEKLSYLATLLPSLPGTGIVYTSTQRNAEIVANFLITQGINAAYYHSSRDIALKEEIEKKLQQNEYKVVCSTNALGMGIDKPDLRFVIHYQLPSSPINYYQEIGRAGRDGEAASCILLYDPEDTKVHTHFIEHARPSSDCYYLVLILIRHSTFAISEYDIARQTGLAQKAIRKIINDLEDQGLIKKGSRGRGFVPASYIKPLDFGDYDQVQQQKQQELLDLQAYTQSQRCYMNYLTHYLGDATVEQCNACKNCQPQRFPLITPGARIQERVAHFLEHECLPCIEKRQEAHEAGWALSYHGISHLGTLVRASKYEQAGPFSQIILERAIHILEKRYPLPRITGIVSVPPTRSGRLVEDLARQIGAHLHVPYLDAIEKLRKTEEQKHLKNSLQKTDNVRGAFLVRQGQTIHRRTLLLIDDIYDSGKMLYEVGKTLMQAGAHAVYPLTITRTLHSDDQ